MNHVNLAIYGTIPHNYYYVFIHFVYYLGCDNKIMCIVVAIMYF